MDDRNFDSETAEEWIRTIESEGARVREGDLYPLLRQWVSEAAPSRVLEIGCGQGACSPHVGGSEYVGVDPSLFLVERATRLYGSDRRRFEIGNAYALPFAERAFDAAFSVAVWHLLADLACASRELARVLKPGGAFLIVAADPGKAAAWESRFDSKDKLYPRSLRELLEPLQAHGLEAGSTGNFRDFLWLAGKLKE